jgi:hypothetical protein
MVSAAARSAKRSDLSSPNSAWGGKWQMGHGKIITLYYKYKGNLYIYIDIYIDI